MKWVLVVLLACFLGLAPGKQLAAQSSYSLNIKKALSKNHYESPESKKQLYLIKIRSHGDVFALGTSNLVFSYNMAALTNPSLVVSHNYSGQTYNNITLTEPVPGRVSINIELFVPFQGMDVLNKFCKVVTIQFDQLDKNEQPNFAWRYVAPNATIVFADDEFTLIPPASSKTRPDNSALGSLPNSNLTEQELDGLRLYPNYPNPFNPVTTIKFNIPKDGQFVELSIYNSLGKLVRYLVRGIMNSGVHKFRWDGFDVRGVPVSSGVYALQLKSGNWVQTRKIMLVR